MSSTFKNLSPPMASIASRNKFWIFSSSWAATFSEIPSSRLASKRRILVIATHPLPSKDQGPQIRLTSLRFCGSLPSSLIPDEFRIDAPGFVQILSSSHNAAAIAEQRNFELVDPGSQEKLVAAHFAYPGQPFRNRPQVDRAGGLSPDLNAIAAAKELASPFELPFQELELPLAARRTMAVTLHPGKI